MHLSRRSLLGLVAAGAFLPRRLLGSSPAGARKIMFIFCPGGWDPTVTFAPLFDTEGVDMPSDSEAATVGGFDIVDSESRLSVRSFFETWGSRSVLVHGISVPSIAHDVCRRIIMTGSSQGNREGWDALIASTSADSTPMPMVHLSGPIYAQEHASSVVRMGREGQLPALLQGTALADSDLPLVAPSATIQELELAFLKQRTAAAAADAGPGWAARLASTHQVAIARTETMLGVADQLTMSGDDSLAMQASIIGECFERGLSRCAMLAYEGPIGQGWDTHSENHKQGTNFEGLFQNVLSIMEDLESRPGASGSLLDETTVVLLSEMGRDPRLNKAAGKDHWPWTSMLMMGGGLQGGRTIGAYNESVSGEPIDYATGELSNAGSTITAEALGATIMALADVDPAEFLEDAAPITAILS